MSDIVSKEKRSQMMAGIKGKDTKPEIIVRTLLHKKGFRYRLHDKKLPGRPDLVFSKYSAVIFINGCFWHGHSCSLFKLPKSNQEFWKEKINGNIARDKRNYNKLDILKWKILIIWECSLRGKGKEHIEEVIFRVENWIRSGEENLEIAGI